MTLAALIVFGLGPCPLVRLNLTHWHLLLRCLRIAPPELYRTGRAANSCQCPARADANPTNAATVNYTVTFSESVTGVNTSDFTLTTAGVSGAAVSEVSGSGASYTVTVNTGTGDGTIRLDVIDNNSIVDVEGNSLDGGFTSGEVYTIQKDVPEVSSVSRANANPTNASSVGFTVTFSEVVTGVDTSDFTLTTTGVSGTSISGVSGFDSDIYSYCEYGLW